MSEDITMSYQQQFYVRFFRDPGSYAEAYTDKSVETHDLQTLEIPAGVYGFQFFRKMALVQELDSSTHPVLAGNVVPGSFSPLYVLGNEAIQSQFSAPAAIPGKNFETHTAFSVKTVTGRYHPLNKGDIVLHPETRKEVFRVPACQPTAYPAPVL